MSGQRVGVHGRGGVCRGVSAWKRTTALFLGLSAPLGVDRCAIATAPRDGSNVTIILEVTGGIAGVDWKVTIDGPRARIIGDRCRDRIACDWESGEILATVSPEEVKALADRFFELEFFRGDPDHGTECCDQFEYALTYEDPDDVRTVIGSDGRLPQRIRDLIAEVRGFVEDARGAG